LRAVLAFVGISDIEIIHAEGRALGPTHREAALNASKATFAAGNGTGAPRQALIDLLPGEPPEGKLDRGEGD
jgi:hypothetical protein